jgi:hypothetical protein
MSMWQDLRSKCVATAGHTQATVSITRDRWRRDWGNENIIVQPQIRTSVVEVCAQGLEGREIESES